MRDESSLYERVLIETAFQCGATHADMAKLRKEIRMKCRKGYEIKPCKSAAGWYMGTQDEMGRPNCRLSTRYAQTAEEAEKLPLDRDYAMEVSFCNDGLGCVEKDDIGVKDFVLNLRDRLLDLESFVESDTYIDEKTPGFNNLCDISWRIHDTLVHLDMYIDKYIPGATQRV